MKPILIFILFCFTSQVFAQTNLSSTTVEKQKPIVLFKPDYECARSYIYKNKSYPIDSKQRKDGEGLRQVLKANSKSEEMLNNYQNRTNSLLVPAYIGTLGVLTLISGFFYTQTLSSHVGRRDTNRVYLSSGFALLAGSYFYGRYALNSKEKTLEKAIENYNNSAAEKEKIQFNLSPVFEGTGGKIQTIIPF